MPFKTDLTVEQVERKCQLMAETHTSISFKTVARYLGVSAGLLANPRREFRAVVERYRTQEQVGDRSKQLREKRRQFGEAIARSTEPNLKTWVDPTIKGSWTPAMGEAHKARMKRREKSY